MRTTKAGPKIGTNRRVSAEDGELLAALQKAREGAEEGIVCVARKYLGDYPYEVVPAPTSYRPKGRGRQRKAKVDMIFFDDGNGHCGVYDFRAMVCEAIEC